MQEKAVAFHWRKFKERYSFIGSRCEHCNGCFYPARVFCPSCRRKGKLSEMKFSGKGKVHSFTVVRTPPEGFEPYAPYIIVMVDLLEGGRVISQLVGCAPEEVSIGMEVMSCFRKIRDENKSGLILYGFKFKPAMQPGK